MSTPVEPVESDILEQLVKSNCLFRGLEPDWLGNYLSAEELKVEKFFPNRPIYTAFLPEDHLEHLYLVINEGLVIIRSAPLDRIISINYPGSCFGMRSLDFSFGRASRAFPSPVEAYKTTHVVKITVDALERIYTDSEEVRDRYRLLFELREKFQYHLLNCSTYPPQAVAALLRALIYQERELGNQPNADGIYTFDLPIDVIARACQLNQRTVEQVLKGMQQVELIRLPKGEEVSKDMLYVLDGERLKEVYSATRDKVAWWPLR